MARALAAAIAVSLLAVSGAGGARACRRRSAAVRSASRGISRRPPASTCCFRSCSAGARRTADTVWRLVLEAPFELGGDLTWRPALVSGATFTNRPPYTLTYHIRPEARWSDGVPVTARDFAFTHAAILRHDTGRREGAPRPRSGVSGLVDPKTVRVVLRTRFARLARLLRGILPGATRSRGADLTKGLDGTGSTTREPVARSGAGRSSSGAGSAGGSSCCVRNSRYWGPHPAYVDRLVIRFVGAQGEDLVGLLRSGQVHVAYNFPPSVVGEAS